jgi:hypothetical protein
MARKPPATIGSPVDAGPRTWVQTDKRSHEAWGRLIRRKPRAADLLHQLIANLGSRNAVVIGQKTLAKLMECNTRTVQRAIDDLVKEQWIQVVRLGPGTACAYVVNARVAWGERREHLHLAVFDATIIADAQDQPAETLERKDLRRIPTILPGERQLPSGDGEPLPSEPPLPGFETDLPSIEGE